MKLRKRKVLVPICLLLLAALLSSCSTISSILHMHTYRYEFDEGKHWKICTECGETFDEETHTLKLQESADATCEQAGYTLLECAICGYTRTNITPALPHRFEAVPGSDTRICSICHREETTLTELPESERYGYRHLASLRNSEKYLRAYSKLSIGIANRKEKVSINESLSKEELELIFHCCSVDHPEYFWLAPAYEYSYTKSAIKEIQLSYLVSAGDFEKAKTAFRNAADALLAGISSGASDFEKELYLHDAIVSNAVYDETYTAPLTHSAYGNLVLGTSVCDGYAELLQYLLCRCGILATTLSGYSGENHSWNVVLIDGDWYMVDPTWDDPIGQASGEASHNYFNCTWEQFSLDHSFILENGEPAQNYFEIPSCNSVKYNYFTYYGYEGELSLETIDKVVRAQVKAGQSSRFQIRFTGHGTTAEEKEAAIRSFLKSTELTIYPVLAKALGRPSYSLTISYSISKDGEILKLSVD